MSATVARLETSTPLQDLHKILSDGQEHSGLELAMRISTTCLSTWISHLRRNGKTINCRQEVRNGRRWAFYTMVGEAQEAA